MDPAERLHRPYRWVVLAAYVLAIAVTQMLWLNFAPLQGLVQQRYGVSELQSSMLVLVYPLLYVVFSVPAGALTDRRGYRFTVGLGIVTTAAFSVLRTFDSSFWMILAGQVGLAVAQPFVVNGISKLVADWFDAAQGALATGLGTMGMFLGMAVGMASTPAMVQSLGLRSTLSIFSGISVAVALFFLTAARANAPGRASAGAEPEAGAFRSLLRQRPLMLIFGVAFLGMGAFNGLTTWLEQILAPRGISPTSAGLVGGVMILGGIIGAVLIPLLSDRLRRRKPFLLLCGSVAAALAGPLCLQDSVPLLMGVGAALGFFFMPAFALLLDMSSQLAGSARAGAATSLLMLCGNGGGVAVIIAVPLVKNAAGGFGAAVAMLVALLVGAVLLSSAAPETFGRSPELSLDPERAA